MTQLELNIKHLLDLGISVKGMSGFMGKENAPSVIKGIDTKKGYVEAYFSVFDVVDSDGDVIRKGAFKKTFKEHRARIKHLYNHDRTKGAGVIEELVEDNYGAYFVSKISPSTLGKDILLEYEAGIITEHSHGFVPIMERPIKEGGVDVNEITEVKLWEVSSLTAWGANHMARTVAVKETDLIEAVKKMLRTANISDERGKLWEKHLKELENRKALDFYEAIKDLQL